jgi:hypothetical protein
LFSLEGRDPERKSGKGFVLYYPLSLRWERVGERVKKG